MSTSGICTPLTDFHRSHSTIAVCKKVCITLVCVEYDSLDTVLPQYGIPIDHESRQVSQRDFYNFTHILASDQSNLNNLLRLKPGDSTAEVKLWGSYLGGEPIADPYYGGAVSWHCALHHEIQR